MQKVLISACLLGEQVKYNGGDNLVNSHLLRKWQAEHMLVPCCPETEGGLSTPRNPAEIRGGDGKDVIKGTAAVVDNHGHVVSSQFLAGAQAALELADKLEIRIAILKERSPSCGSQAIYGGEFDGSIKKGKGVTASLLVQHGIQVFNEDQLEEVETYLQSQA